MAITNIYNKLARLFSTLFVPPSLTVIVFFYFAFSLENRIEKSIIVFAIALIFGFILPIVLFVYMRRRGKIVDVDASKKEERTLPFLIAVISYSGGLILLIFFHANIISIALWFCYISNTLLTALINRHWKISAHAMGVAGPMAAVSFVNINFALVLGFILLMTGWSRVKLNCHTLFQVLAGALLGTFSTYFQILYILKYFNYAR